MKTSVTPTTRLAEQPEPEPQEPRAGKETGAETLPHGRCERNPAGCFAGQLGGLRQQHTLTCRPAAVLLGIYPGSRGLRPHGNPRGRPWRPCNRQTWELRGRPSEGDGINGPTSPRWTIQHERQTRSHARKTGRNLECVSPSGRNRWEKAAF